MIKFFTFYKYEGSDELMEDIHPELVRAHPSFLEQLCRQVTKELERLTGVSGFGKGVYFSPSKYWQSDSSGVRVYKDGHDYMRLNMRWYL